MGTIHVLGHGLRKHHSPCLYAVLILRLILQNFGTSSLDHLLFCPWSCARSAPARAVLVLLCKCHCARQPARQFLEECRAKMTRCASRLSARCWRGQLFDAHCSSEASCISREGIKTSLLRRRKTRASSTLSKVSSRAQLPGQVSKSPGCLSSCANIVSAVKCSALRLSSLSRS